jgi:hypothetical protein
MARFDAELYLRTAGEEMILGIGPARQRPWDLPLTEPASALLAVGAISAAKARAVIDDYMLAEALRGDAAGQHRHHRIAMARAHQSRQPKTKALKPRRVVPCGRTIEDANGTLHVRHVTLSEESTALAITWRRNPSGQSRSRRRGRSFMHGHGTGGPHHPQLSDDRGTSVSSGFGGGGSDDQWEGHLTAHQPLAPDTAWIEIDGQRIELTGEAVPCAVAIERVAEQASAHRYLWRRLAVPDFHGPPEIEASIEALIAAGALERGDPVLGDLRAVREAMPDHPGMHAGGKHGTRRLPEPWRSLLSRLGREDGPEGTVALSAVTPEFEGFSVAVGCLESRADGFGIEVDVAPGLELRGPFRNSLESRQLSWWAADDRGNHYLGQIGSWSGGEDYSTGEIGFWPALHPKARRLQILPTAQETRASIAFTLPWARPSPGKAGDLP